MAHASTARHGYHGRTEDSNERDEHDDGADRVNRRADERTLVANESVQRSIYGGFNFGAAFFGWLITVGITVIISAILSGAAAAIVAGTVKQITPDGIANSAMTTGIVSGVLLLITLAIAYYTGGYVAGRMSRFDGARQGVGLWIIGLIVGIILAASGSLITAAYSGTIMQQIHLPSISINQGAVVTSGIVMFILSLLVSLIAAIIGGKVGEGYHRKIDRAGAIEP